MWSDAQKLMNDSWSVAAGPLTRVHEERVRTWERWVHRALEQQREWAQTMTARAAELPGLPEPMGSLIEQTQAANGRYFAMQDAFWSRWFDFLRQGPGAEANEAVEANVAVAVTPPVADPAPVEASPTPPVEFEAEDDLTAITGVGPAIEAKLRAAGVNTYRAIAAWTEADIERIEASALSGRFAGRIGRDGWIDQARWLHAEKYGRAV